MLVTCRSPGWCVVRNTDAVRKRKYRVIEPCTDRKDSGEKVPRGKIPRGKSRGKDGTARMRRARTSGMTQSSLAQFHPGTGQISLTFRFRSRFPRPGRHVGRCIGRRVETLLQDYASGLCFRTMLPGLAIFPPARENWRERAAPDFPPAIAGRGDRVSPYRLGLQDKVDRSLYLLHYVTVSGGPRGMIGICADWAFSAPKRHPGLATAGYGARRAALT